MIYDDAFSMYVCVFSMFFYSIFFLRRLKFRAAEKKYKKKERERAKDMIATTRKQGKIAIFYLFISQKLHHHPHKYISNLI